MGSDSLSSVNGGKTIVSNNFEVSLMDPNLNVKIPVTSVTGTCPIWITLTATVPNVVGTPNIKCKYYNENTKALDDTGCTVKSKTSLGFN